MKIPSDRRYTKDHEWIKIEGSTATVGITEFAQGELGELVFAELPSAGKATRRGETLCVVESTKAASDVYSPVGGKVKEVNSKLSNSPDLINKSPYEEGWMVVLENLEQGDIGELLDANQYSALVDR